MSQRPSSPRKEIAINKTVTAKKVIAHPYSSLIVFLSIMFVLHQCGGVAVVVGCASLLSIQVAVAPENFRSRSGSMLTAKCLVAFMWVAAAAVTTVTMIEGF